MDLTALPAWLFTQGPWGVAVACLIGALVFTQRKLDGAITARIEDLKTGSAALHTALVASTEAMKANTGVQDRSGQIATGLGEALRGVEVELERVRESIDRLSRERRP